MKFPSLAAVAVVGACAAAASRLAVAPALGLLSTADALGSYRPDPAVQVVAGVWTMTGVNVEDALANGDVIAAAIADVAGVAASQVVIDGVTQADRRRLDDAQALLNVAYRITGLTEAMATSAARRMDRGPDPGFDAALRTAAAEAGPFETIVFEAAETTDVTGATVTTPRPTPRPVAAPAPRPPTPDPAPSPRPPTPDPAPSPRPPTPDPDPAPAPEPEPEPAPAPAPEPEPEPAPVPEPEPEPAPVPEPEPEPAPAPRPPPNQIFFDDDVDPAPAPAPAPEDEDENEGNDEYG